MRREMERRLWRAAGKRETMPGDGLMKGFRPVPVVLADREGVAVRACGRATNGLWSWLREAEVA
jgi:hypothetical protein